MSDKNKGKRGSLSFNGRTLDCYPQAEIKNPLVKFRLNKDDGSYIACVWAAKNSTDNAIEWDGKHYGVNKNVDPNKAPGKIKWPLGSNVYLAVVAIDAPAPTTPTDTTPTPPAQPPVQDPPAIPTPPAAPTTPLDPAPPATPVTPTEPPVSTPPIQQPTPVEGNYIKPTPANCGQIGDVSKLKDGGGVLIMPGKAYEGYHFKNLKVALAAGQAAAIRNCLIDAQGSDYAIDCHANAGKLEITNNVIVNAAAAGIYGRGFVATKNIIKQSAGDGIKPSSDAVIQGNYFDDLGYKSPNAHADGVQIRGGSNIKILGNWFNLKKTNTPPADGALTKDNAGVFVQLPCKGIVVDGNWIESDNWGIHAYPEGGTMIITNNLINAYKGLEIGLGSGATASGNKHIDGTPIAGR